MRYWAGRIIILTKRRFDVGDCDLTTNLDRRPDECARLRDHVQRVPFLHRSHGEDTLPHAIENLAVLGLVAPDEIVQSFGAKLTQTEKHQQSCTDRDIQGLQSLM